MQSRFTRVSVSATVLFALLCGSATADAQTVVARKRLGNNTEGITFFSHGNGRNVAVIDGYDVFNIRLPAVNSGQRARPCDPTQGHSRRTCRQLFNVSALGTIAPRGIAFVASQDRFYFSAVDPTRLYATDVDGAVLPPLDIVHKNDPSDISQWEGLGYVPPDSPIFPDTIIGITIHNGLRGTIQIIGLDGVVLREIVFPQGSPLFSYLGGIAYKAPDRLLVTAASNDIFEITFDGTIVDEAHPVAGAQGPFEGLTTIEDGRVVAAEYSTGRLFVLDNTFERRPGDDRDFVVGLGITASRLAWNPDTGEFLVSDRGSAAARVFAVSSNLKQSRLVADLANTRFASSPVRGLGYLAGEDQVAISTFGTRIRGIALFDTTTGAFVPPRLALDPPFPVPRDVTALPAICPDCLAVRVIVRDPLTGALRTEIRVITRTGTPHPTDADAIVPMELPPIVLSCEPIDGGLTFHSSPAGDRIVAGVSFYDLAGTFIERIDKAALGVSFVSAIASVTSGTHQGLFAVIEAQTSELIVFSKTNTRFDCPLP
jgi:hypothetical protein